MVFVIGLLTVGMVLDCLALILLVLIKLPKKEAGAGLAFGGTATDALFGAGSGNVLTKITKYAAGLFFVLALVLSVMQSHVYYRTHREFQNAIEKAGSGPSAAVTPPVTTPTKAATTPGALPSGTNYLTVTPAAEATNMPAASANPAATPAAKK